MSGATFAFGSGAERWASAYDARRTTLVVAPDAAVTAYAKAVELRADGICFDLVLLWPDRRASVAALVAAQKLAEDPDYDRRRLALAALAKDQVELRGFSVNRLLAVDVPTMTAARDTIMLCERLLVRSWTEWRRITFEMGLLVANVEVVEVPDPSVPAVEREQSDGSVVVWAPFTPLTKLAIVATALQELHAPVVFVCDEGSAGGLDVTRVAHADAAAVLAQARVVVVPDNEDPAPARALARLGIPLCVSITSGAREFLFGVEAFRPWHRKSVLGAVLAAAGAAAPVLRARSPQSDAQAPSAAPATPEAPLVSVVVRTYDQREFLGRALRSIARQTYPRIETIVVNGGGVDVSDLVAGLPGARLITQERNDYRKVTNAGMRAANGTYVARLDGDDFYFPEHVATLVAAAERAHADVVFADAVTAFVDGARSVAGYIVTDDEAVSRSRMLGANQLIAPMLRMLIRKATLDRVGGFSEALYYADDYEVCLRLLAAGDFVHVDRVTSIYTMFEEGTNLSQSRDQRNADAHRLLYTLHPIGDRPIVAQRRRRIMEQLERDGYLPLRRPPWRFSAPVPLPGFSAEEHGDPAD